MCIVNFYAYLTVGMYVLNMVWHEHGLGSGGGLNPVH